MNLFRSEEHVRNFARFDPSTEDGIIPLPDVVKVFSVDYFRRRLESDYFSQRMKYRDDMLKTLKEIRKSGPFW
jgi:hypothetical protein